LNIPCPKFPRHSIPGLPDAFFSDQKSQFGYILEDLGIENVEIYSGHWKILRSLGTVLGQLIILWSIGIFFPTWYIVQKKNRATL
jgi:hypothetical protein